MVENARLTKFENGWLTYVIDLKKKIYQVLKNATLTIPCKY